MTLFPTPCREPGCSTASRAAYCDDHQRADSRAPSYRGSRHKRGYGAGHERWRGLVLERDPVCVGWPASAHRDPTKRTCWNMATVADHRVPMKLRQAGRERALLIAATVLDRAAYQELERADDWRDWLRYSLSNGQGMCQGCHNRKTAEGL